MARRADSPGRLRGNLNNILWDADKCASTLLEAAGFHVVFAALFDRPTELVGPDGLKEWIRMFVKIPFTVITSEAEREAILDQVADDLRSELYVNGKWYADYVRLRMKALRGIKGD